MTTMKYHLTQIPNLILQDSINLRSTCFTICYFDDFSGLINKPIHHIRRGVDSDVASIMAKIGTCKMMDT